jgi:hypothetical protein
MAVVEPYSPCPCGSGQKFKWCCQKVEAQAERAHRLFENGQAEGAIEVLDEGLRKEPGNPWLLTRKAIYQLRQRKPDAAKETLRLVLARHPKHLGALLLLTRLAVETDDLHEAVAQVQQAITVVPESNQAQLAPTLAILGVRLYDDEFHAAALKHLELAHARNRDDSMATGSIAMMKRSGAVSPWLKNPYALAPAPADAPASVRERFDRAIEWSDAGMWGSAAAAFETLSADAAARPAADRNLGLCRLWLADEPAAYTALRRALANAANTPDAVDLEAVCQLIAPLRSEDLVDQVRLTWPLRDRAKLLDALRANPLVHENDAEPADPEDPESPEHEQFVLLDRAVVAPRADLRTDEIPRVIAHVSVEPNVVALVTYDDGTLDEKTDRLTTLGGAAISPAHPKTEVLRRVTREALRFSLDWLIPQDAPRETFRRLNSTESARLVREEWPKTPLASLGGKTPLQAASAGGHERALRAAVRRFEVSPDGWARDFDFAALRAMLKIDPEPPIDPATVDIAKVHVARLDLVPPEGLDDQKLSQLYVRAHEMGMLVAVDRAARALVARPVSDEQTGFDPMMPCVDLALLAAERGEADAAFNWVRTGRERDPASKRAANAPKWDMIEIRIKATVLPPETWVPDLAVVMERYAANSSANSTVIMGLSDMGLINLSPHPERPNEIMLDPRPLQALMSMYGPRITTASGQLGVAAKQGALWTPGSDPGTASPGGLWTPGSSTAPSPSGDKPRLIIGGH